MNKREKTVSEIAEICAIVIENVKTDAESLKKILGKENKGVFLSCVLQIALLNISIFSVKDALKRYTKIRQNDLEDALENRGLNDEADFVKRVMLSLCDTGKEIENE